MKKSVFHSDFKDLAPLCEDEGIECKYVQNVNDQESIQFIRKVHADVGFCFGWSQLIHENVINEFPKGIIGFHPAALPYNRGRHPIVWVLALGLKSTASTFFRIDKNADTGDILLQENIEILYEDNAETLYEKIMETAREQLEKLVEGLENNRLVPKHQSQEMGNVWRKRSIGDGRIDFRMSGRAIYNLVRSLTKPYPGAHIEWKDAEYKVWRVCEITGTGFENIEPGKIIEVYKDGSFDVKTSDNIIRVLECDVIDIEKGDYFLP
ncbi:MAG: methionyl-tRNA formyltransferase [Roseburia sp.]|nr:methionyl-tRNA formyltransferase [Roseburia sp.]